MGNRNTIAKIRTLISLNKPAKAILLLEKIVVDTETKDELILLKSKINSNNKLERLGTIDPSQIKMEASRITKALLAIAREIDSNANLDNGINEIEILEDLLSHLGMTSNIFKVQRKLRKKLYHLLTSRLENLTFDNKYHLMLKYYHEMNIEELRTHKTIRGFTEDIIKKHNYKALELLQENPSLQKRIVNLNTLELHLTIWKSKFESTFHSDEAVCWIYAGINEGMGFPDGIEDEIRRHLDN